MAELDAIVREFLVESHENLDQLDRDFVVLEQEPDNRDRLASVFRAIHTIKGTCGFFGFGRLEKLTHVGENLLSKLRTGELALDGPITTALLGMVDAVRAMLTTVERTGHDGESDYPDLIETLTRLQVPRPADTVAEPPTPPPTPPRTIGEVLVSQGKVTPAQIQEAIDQQRRGDPLHLGEILVEKNVVKVGDVRDAVHTLKDTRPAAADTSIRVDVGLLDRLMTLVGELVLARNQLIQFAAAVKDGGFHTATQRLNLITTELQEGVMKTRMQPIGNVWDRFPRVVRDLALACGKRVRLEMDGKETELDKTLIEAIKDPLTHIIRNSADHGIEPPELRVARGKPAEGVLRLRAYHEGGQVNIEVSDDGGGIDPDRVRRKAVEKGLITPDRAARMDDREATQLIFLPGFSTAEAVTNVSGRGVGMDVVKTNIEKVGGTIDLHSRPGLGTTLKIKIPLTLAIVPALVVTAGGDRYAIPQVSLIELVRLSGPQARAGVEQVSGADVYRLRGRLLPLVDLAAELGVPASAEPDDVTIVVLQAGDHRFGLVVDAVSDTQEIVVKPLGPQFHGLTVYSGATIMGDGRVALILDVPALAQAAGVLTESRDRGPADTAASPVAAGGERQTLLVLGVDPDRRMAVPLSSVARLEEIPPAAVERADGHEVVQYRGHIMPLVRLNGQPAGGPLQVVVFAHAGRSVGLVVDRIHDVIEQEVEVRHPGRQAGVIGSVVLQERVTELLDVRGLIAAADPFFHAPAIAG